MKGLLLSLFLVEAGCLLEDKLSVVTVATNISQPGLCRLAHSAVRLGYHLHILGTNATFDDPVTAQEHKPRLLLEFVKEQIDFRDDHIFVFVDGFDVLCQAPPNILLESHRTMGSPKVLFSGETYCFPFQSYCSKYPKLHLSERVVCLRKVRGMLSKLKIDPVVQCASPSLLSGSPRSGETLVFPFLNSGMFMATKAELITLLEKFLGIYRKRLDLHGQSDQSVFHELLVKSISKVGSQPISVDRSAKIFLNACCPRGMLTRGLVKWNKSLNSFNFSGMGMPSFIHWSGQSWYKDFMFQQLTDALSSPSASQTGQVWVQGAAHSTLCDLRVR